MLAICIESSHQRGLGHLFRCINLVRELKRRGEQYIVLLNPDEHSEGILRKYGVLFETVDLCDFESGWESKQIRRHGITIWLNDRMGTDLRSSKQIKSAGACLFAIDDTGDGAALCDLNIVPIPAQGVHYGGKRVLTGVQYLVLNPEIDRYRRTRLAHGRLVVSLGGSDTYGVTVHVASFLQVLGQEADIVLGPAFSHEKVLCAQLNCDNRYRLLRGVSSLPALFHSYNTAITGGGLTPFEAAAAGLPCVIIANESHEETLALFLEEKGCGIYAGHRSVLDAQRLYVAINRIKLPEMSLRGQKILRTDGAGLIIDTILG